MQLVGPPEDPDLLRTTGLGCGRRCDRNPCRNQRLTQSHRSASKTRRSWFPFQQGLQLGDALL